MNHNNITCNISDSEAELVFKDFPGYQDGKVFNIYHCNKSNTSFSLPQVDTNAIYEAIYKNGEKVPGYDRYWKYFKAIKDEKNPLQYLSNCEEAYWGIKTALEQINEEKSKLNILEIGSGLGYLTYALKKFGYNIQGLELSQEAVNKANNHFGDYYICGDLFKYSKTHKETFDIVILTEVIEHIDDPIRFIEEITLLLKVNGKIILTTPNKTLIPKNIVWATDLPPVHHWWFSEQSMEAIANKLNLNVSFINFKGFYKKFPKAFKLRRKSKNRLPSPILNKDLSLKRVSKIRKKRPIKSLIKSLPILKIIFLKTTKLFGSKNIIYSKRGDSLCAVFSKK